MGRSSAEGMLTTGMTLDGQLEWHLQHNHFPPITTRMVPACREAITLVADGDWETTVTVGGGKLAVQIPAGQIVEDLHLDTWVQAAQELDLDV